MREIRTRTRKPWAISKHQKGMSAAVHNSQARLDVYHEHAAHSRPAVRVEYPLEGEAVAQPAYTLCIAVARGTADAVEVSIDQGGWLACREGLGLWWLDWSGYEKGDHELTARTRTAGGIVIASDPRRFRVE